MLTLLHASQRQRSPVEWGEGRKVRGGGMVEDNPRPFQWGNLKEVRDLGKKKMLDSQGRGKKGARH